MQNKTKMPDKKKNLLWAVLSVGIAAGSIYAVLSQSKDISLKSLFLKAIHLKPLWLVFAVFGMFSFIVFEAVAICATSRELSHPTSFFRATGYTSADIYFSAITPSATGGQPACAYLMLQDGYPGSVVASILLLNLTMYALAIIVIGVFCFVFQPDMFNQFGAISKFLIIMGCLVQIFLTAFFLLLSINERLLKKLCNIIVAFLYKIHLLKDKGSLQRKFDNAMDEYKDHSGQIFHKKNLILRVFLYNFMQRSSQIIVSVCIFLGMGGSFRSAFDVAVIQGYVMLGATFIPIPGAMAVTDYLMLDGFKTLMSAQQAIDLELISRSLSFYFCIFFCVVILLFRILFRKMGKRGEKQI